MFNPNTIKACLTGLIGFRQSYNANTDRLDNDLVTSLSGIIVDQSVQPLITTENIVCIIDVFSKTNVAAWSGTVNYLAEDITTVGGVVYQAIRANTNSAPASNPLDWTVTNLISAYLRRVLSQAAINLFNKVFAERRLHEVGKTILTDTSLYDGTGNLTDTVTKYGRFVGYEITPRNRDTVVRVLYAGLQLKEAQAGLKLYLYQQSSKEALSETTINQTKAVTFQWHQLATAIEAAFNTQTVADACKYWLGYYEDDLGANSAIYKEDLNWANNGCSSCSTLNAYLYRRWNNFFGIQPFYVPAAFLPGDKTMWDYSKNIYLQNQTFGLNFKMEVVCDVSDFICRHKFAFADALKWQVVKDILNEMAFSMRDNQQKGKVVQAALFALNGDEKKDRTVNDEYKDAVAGINFEISDMSSVCLPCMDANTGVELTSVYGHTAST